MSASDKEIMAQAAGTPYTSFGSSAPDLASTTPTESNQTRGHAGGAVHSFDGASSPGYSLAQISWAPSIQTTVVTTTTTTSTSFPPLVMKDPASLLDSKEYPLAAAPTPAPLRRISFNHDGQKAVFEEAVDPQAATRTLQRQRSEMEDGGGTTRHVKRRKLESPADSVSRKPFLPKSKVPQLPAGINEVDSIQTPVSMRRFGQRSFESRQSRLNVMQTSTPITPSLDRTDDEQASPTRGPSQQPSPSRPSNSRGGLRVEIPSTIDTETASAGSPRKPSLTQTTQELDALEAQDASLPSPSLSPVRAAANMAAGRRGYFDHSETLVNRSPPNEMADEELNRSENQDTQALSTFDSFLSGSTDVSMHRAPLSMMDIPTMFSTYESMPQSMKSYVMFQLLRRSEKNVLQFVAESVNPALKCDFLTLLPPELGQNVLGYLDAKSLCRAAQVSKKWRQVVDQSEKTWKDLLARDDLTLGPLELRRAIMEGWGWQFGSENANKDWEKNIGPTLQPDSESAPAPVQAPSLEEEEEYAVEATLHDLSEQASSSKRPSKRKSAGKLRTTARKLQKRKAEVITEPAPFDTTALLKQVTSHDGPFAAAKVALMALPNPEGPDVGLPSLRSLHLYKSLYRRQYLIDSYWMNERLKPKHLAFKAHERHVVTCLHFDAERILTGSDDTNINVYDTKTGAQRDILKGHEGGVWALKCYGNTLVSGSTDRSVRVWDIEAGRATHVFHGHTSTVRCLVILTPTVIGRNEDGSSIIMPREPLIITGSRDSTLRVWKLPQPKDHPVTKDMSVEDMDTHYFVRALTGHAHSVRAIAAHGDTLVSGSYDTTVRVWKVSTGESTFTLRGHTQKVYSVVLDNKRNRCISGSMDNTVRMWSLTDGTCLYNLEGHNSLVGLLDLKGDRLVSAAADSTLRIWDPQSGHCKATLMAHTGAITCFQHDARKVISGSDRTLKMWDAKTGEFVRDLLTDLSGVWQVGFDGRRCVAAVQRDQLTYIEVLDFGAARDGVPPKRRGVRIEVDRDGQEMPTSPIVSDPNDVLMALADLPAGVI